MVDTLEVAGKGGKGAIGELLDDASQSSAIGIHDIPGEILATRAKLVDLGCGESKDRLVLSTSEVDDLDIGAVHGPEGDGTVHHELHVRGARGLLARSGNLLGDLGGRVDQLSVGYTEVGDEADFMMSLTRGSLFTTLATPLMRRMTSLAKV